MRDDLTDIFGSFIPEHSHEDPVRRAQIQMKRPLPKRFYSTVTVAQIQGGHGVQLDGRGVKTPAKNTLAAPTLALAQMIAAEWQAQAEVIDPATMPVTRLVNTAIDAVASQVEAVAEEIVRFAGTDMLCYRADGPERLVERQEAGWDPLIAWMRETHGAHFILTAGIMHQAQPEETLKRFSAALVPFRSAIALSCLHTLTTLSGSAILALALAEKRLTLDEAWALAHLDEDWTNDHWGRDMEAEARRATRFIEFKAAHDALRALGG